MTNDKDKLRDAYYYLFAGRDRWLKYNMAELEDGTDCRPNDPNACRFCALGALVRACAGDFQEAGRIGQIVLSHSKTGRVRPGGLAGEIVRWNDRKDTKYIDVLSAFSDAMASA